MYWAESDAFSGSTAITVQVWNGQYLRVEAAEAFLEDSGNDVYLVSRQFVQDPRVRPAPMDPASAPEWIAFGKSWVEAHASGWSGWNRTRIIANGTPIVSGVSKVVGTTGGKIDYKYNQLDTFNFITEFGIYTNGSASRFASAYRNAIDALDTGTVNSLENLLGLASSIGSLTRLIRSKPSVSLDPDGEGTSLITALRASGKLDPRNIWLMYRYQMMTSIMDLDEYKVMLQRLGDLAWAGEKIHTSGYFSDETGSYKAELTVNTDLILPSNSIEFLAATGFAPTASNLWDLVPYSFVVDWFFHINKIIEWADSYYKMLTVPVKDVWFTYKSADQNQYIFYRVNGRLLDIPPAYIVKQASEKTIKMRVADTLSLFT
jgi:hypothetical protein